MRRVLAVLAVVAVTVLGAGAAAHADQGSVTRTTLTGAKAFPPTAPGGRTLLLSRSVTLAAGESRHVRGRLEATSSTTATVAMDDIVECHDAAGAVIGITSASARNHEGYDTTSYAIDGHLPIYADLLFTAPTAGTYTCGVWGWTAASSGGSYTLTAVAGNTWLEVSDTDQRGAHWWQNPVCDSTGTSATCAYVGAGTSSAWVFYTDGTPAYRWIPAAGATGAEAQANLTLTTCYKNTASCRSAVGPYEKARGTNSSADIRLEAIQLDPTAHTCRTTSTATTRVAISDEAHHYVAYLKLPTIPIDTSCGTREFILRIYVGYVSGNPLKIDGLQGNISLTNAIMMNHFG